jgi:hypothetical protein
MKYPLFVCYPSDRNRQQSERQIHDIGRACFRGTLSNQSPLDEQINLFSVRQCIFGQIGANPYLMIFLLYFKLLLSDAGAG